MYCNTFVLVKVLNRVKKISVEGETEKDSDGNEMKRLFIAGANWAPPRLFN